MLIPKISNLEVSFESKIIDKTNYGSFVKYKADKIFLPWKNIEIGTKVRVTGILELAKNSKPDFDLITYLKARSVFLIINKPKITFLEKSHDIFFGLRQLFTTNNYHSRMLVPMIFLGETPVFANDLRKWLILLGVYQIFVISGFHINLFKQVFYAISKALRIKKYIYRPIFFAFLLFQLFLFNFAISFLRGFVFWTLNQINETFLNKKLNKIDTLSISGILILLSNVLVFYSLGFILSFTISFIIVIINQVRFPKKWHKFIVNFLFVNLFSGLFSAFYNSNYNMMSPLNTLVFTAFFTLFYIIMFIFIFNPTIIEWISDLFVNSVGFITEIQFLVFDFKIQQYSLIISCIISLICFLFMEATFSLSRKRFSPS
ncbi:ComEC/Rec2 family competence protein [Mycoplasma sp. 'Moose RK']|uniref:ComEC/Rec2 family competence protein n=1 Tax=Mycoplasma sp. 'Moose RK' TaxID=2780095 RepID=UPI00280ACB06|nr:ComEC/Rec2 family competence protein [Mycoplasma sp. 'Moose RK']